MISSKILPAFYLIELEGEAANLDFLFGQDFGIEHVRIGSLDFSSDLEAARAGQEVVEFFSENGRLDLNSLEEKIEYNPEFYPTLKPLDLTDDQKMAELITQEAAEESTSETQLAVVLTRHFDSLGDFVAIRLSAEGSNFKMMMRVAVNPEVYLVQKGAHREATISDAARPHRELITQFVVH